MNSIGVTITMVTIAVLAGMLTAVIAGFLKWLDTKKATAAILTSGTAFIAVTTAMITIFTTVGPLNG